MQKKKKWLKTLAAAVTAAAALSVGMTSFAARSYVVQHGDSLSKIAQKELGEEKKWFLLYTMNRDIIRNPDQIHPGQVISLPDLPAPETPTEPTVPAAPTAPTVPTAPTAPTAPAAPAVPTTPADPAAMQVNIRATEIPADGVFNNEGYGSLRINGAGDIVWGLPEDIVLPQAALVDRNGKLTFPYSPTALRYRVSGGIVSLTESSPWRVSSDNAPGSPTFYKLDGSKAFELVPRATETTIDGFFMTTRTYSLSSGPVWEGYAQVVEHEAVDSSSVPSDRPVTSSGASHGEGPVASYIIDQNGAIVSTLPEGFHNAVSDSWYDAGSVAEYNMGWCGEGLFAFSYTDRNAIFGTDPDAPNLSESKGYMDLAGNVVIDLAGKGYGVLNPFHGSLATVKDANGKWGAIDRAGNQVIPCIYDGMEDFFSDDGLCAASLNGKCGYIDRNNNVIIPFEYDDAYGAWGGLAQVVKDGKCGLVDYSNRVVVPLEYDDMSSPENGVAYAIKDRTLYVIEAK